MLFLDIKVHNGTTSIHANNFESGGVSNAKNFAHLVDEFGGTVVGEEISDLLVETDGGLDAVDKGHPHPALGSQYILNILPAIDVLVTATLLFAWIAFSLVVPQYYRLFVDFVCFDAD